MMKLLAVVVRSILLTLAVMLIEYAHAPTVLGSIWVFALPPAAALLVAILPSKWPRPLRQYLAAGMGLLAGLVFGSAVSTVSKMSDLRFVWPGYGLLFALFMYLEVSRTVESPKRTG
jgi:hypothetical protein